MRSSSDNGKRKGRAIGSDRMSQLPDDILISIISQLTLREATATSILSTRWRYLSTYITRLTFPALPVKSISFDNLDEYYTRTFLPHVNTIDHVLDSHRGGRVKELRISTYDWEGVNIDKCFEFALAKDVEIIHIYMKGLYCSGRARWGNYFLQLENLMRRQRHPSPSPPSLKHLTLWSIGVDDRDMELLLSNFHLLESLSITNSSTLRNVKIRHSTPKLKRLAIVHTRNLELIEIDYAASLVSIKCLLLPPTYSLTLNDVPKLIELCTNDQRGLTLADILFRMPSSICYQLQTLKLHVSLLCADAYKTKKLPELMSIKHLELLAKASSSCDDPFLLRLICVIEACPSLEKLGIQILRDNESGALAAKNEDKRMNLISPEKKLFQNLKRMKISGFLGTPVEIELAFDIIKNVNSLKVLTVKACDKTEWIAKLASERARKYFQSTPFSFRLVII